MLCRFIDLQCSDANAGDVGLDSSSDCSGSDANQRTDCNDHGHVDPSLFEIEFTMSVLYVALPLALLLGGSALVACLFCIRSGQYDDLETPSVKLLNDEVEP